jgi:hypothetical protein
VKDIDKVVEAGVVKKAQTKRHRQKGKESNSLPLCIGEARVLFIYSFLPQPDLSRKNRTFRAVVSGL